MGEQSLPCWKDQEGRLGGQKCVWEGSRDRRGENTFMKVGVGRRNPGGLPGGGDPGVGSRRGKSSVRHSRWKYSFSQRGC